jgi:hypothetical protein
VKAALRALPRLAAPRYRRLRATHPVYVLAWLRNGVLLGIAGAALLYLLVAVQASSDIATSIRTNQAMADIRAARAASAKAELALESALSTNYVRLIGTGPDYVNYVSDVTTDLALAAENYGASTNGTIDIQSAQGQLETYLQLSDNAVSDAEAGPTLGAAGESYAYTGEQGLESQLCILRKDEQTALSEQYDEWPVDPAAFWWALLGPLIIVLILAGATARLLARHFRRHVSPWLWVSLLLATATAVTAGFLNLDDERTHSRDPLAGHPITLICALLLFLAAGLMAHLAYRRRLADYQFRSS